MNKLLEILAIERHNMWLKFFDLKDKKVYKDYLVDFKNLPKMAKDKHLKEAKLILNKIKKYISVPKEVSSNDTRKLGEVIEKVFDRKIVWSKSAKDKLATRLQTYSIEDICNAFLNLKNEPSQWKLTNYRGRPISWLLHNDDRIDGMLNCHLNGITPSKKETWSPDQL